MICGYNSKAYKSCQTAYNNAEQAFTADGTTIQILGNLPTHTGQSLHTSPNGFDVETSGLYRFSYDVEATPDATGTMTLQLYNGSTPLPCAISSVTTVGAATQSLHIETTLLINTCAVVHPFIYAMISGVAGNVNHVCATALKLA